MTKPSGVPSQNSVMKLLFVILCGLHLLPLLCFHITAPQHCPGPEYFIDLLQVDSRAAVKFIKSCAGRFDMFPLIPHIVRARVFELFELVDTHQWLMFLQTDVSKCILGPEISEQMSFLVEQIRIGQIRQDILPGALQTSLEGEDSNSDLLIVHFFKDAAVTSLWDCFGIFGQISLYQTCTTLNTAFKPRVREAYMMGCPMKSQGFTLSFRKIFKLWQVLPEGSTQRDDLALFLGIHEDFKHYASYVFGKALGKFHHFPWDRELACKIESSRHVMSPVIHLAIYGVNPDVIRTLIKAFPEYMSTGWSPFWAHKMVMSDPAYPLKLVKTALRQGEVVFATLEDYCQVRNANPELISFIVDQIPKPAVWKPVHLSRFIVCVGKKSQLEDILDNIPAKSVKLSLPAMTHLLKVGVDLKKICRPVVGVGLFLFDKVEESMVANLLAGGKADPEFVLTVLKDISPIWQPSEKFVQLAIDLDYSSEFVCSLCMMIKQTSKLL